MLTIGLVIKHSHCIFLASQSMHYTAALPAADTTLDDGAWGCKTRVAGAQSLHTCVPAQPHMHMKHIICCTTCRRFWRVYYFEGQTRDFAWIRSPVHGCTKAHISKFLAATHMIFERDLSKWVLLHLFVSSAPSWASLFMR